MTADDDVPMAVRLLVAAKVLLGALLLVGALYPHGPFEGKGMAYRLRRSCCRA